MSQEEYNKMSEVVTKGATIIHKIEQYRGYLKELEVKHRGNKTYVAIGQDSQYKLDLMVDPQLWEQVAFVIKTDLSYQLESLEKEFAEL